MKTDWVKLMWMTIGGLFLACIILAFFGGYSFWFGGYSFW